MDLQTEELGGGPPKGQGHGCWSHLCRKEHWWPVLNMPIEGEGWGRVLLLWGCWPERQKLGGPCVVCPTFGPLMPLLAEPSKGPTERQFAETQSQYEGRSGAERV